MRRLSTLCALFCLFGGCAAPQPEWEAANPLEPLPATPLGLSFQLSDLEPAPTPETIRLGRWLFYDQRLSADGSVSCATCHRPEFAFSEPTPVSTGIHGQKGGRKAPVVFNLAYPIYPHFFWDGRAASLEEQALGPVQNPIEMGNTLAEMIETLNGIPGYAPYFEEAYGSPEATEERVARALADYERSRMSGNSSWDRWQAGDEGAVLDQVKQGHELFFGKAECNQCHLGENFTDSDFHNLGVGWDGDAQQFIDTGRCQVSGLDEDDGAFKTPTLREVSKHAPYMHDGSLATLRDVVDYYEDGGTPNPHLDPKIRVLGLNDGEIDALVAFLEALEGEGYQDTPPRLFPQ